MWYTIYPGLVSCPFYSIPIIPFLIYEIFLLLVNIKVCIHVCNTLSPLKLNFLYTTNTIPLKHVLLLVRLLLLLSVEDQYLNNRNTNKYENLHVYIIIYSWHVYCDVIFSLTLLFLVLLIFNSPTMYYIGN